MAPLFATPLRASAQIAVVGNAVDEHEAGPGQRYVSSITVRNLTAEPQPVRIYQTDYRFSADGTSNFDSAGTVRRSNAAWIRPSASSVTIPPLADVVLNYAVTVPAIDSLRGTYWSAIMVEGQPRLPPQARHGQIGLGAVFRYAVQVATHLPTAGSRKVRLTKLGAFTDSTRARVLDVVVENAGERAYRPNLWVELYDARGALRKRLEQQRGLLYPGTSVKQHFDFGVLPAGVYKALVFADTGDDTVSAAQYKLTY
ncbi:MAG TPA: hypothetical protein VFP15_10190 [Gemmatimonadaceae bacterium]|nr:hypothetical protein [Gemmatimonadaceae bacterium]